MPMPPRPPPLESPRRRQTRQTLGNGIGVGHDAKAQCRPAASVARKGQLTTRDGKLNMLHRVRDLSGRLAQSLVRSRRPISFEVELTGPILIRYGRDDDHLALDRLAALDSRILPEGPVLARRDRWRACRRGASRSQRRASERPILAHRQPPRVAETPGMSHSAERPRSPVTRRQRRAAAAACGHSFARTQATGRRPCLSGVDSLKSSERRVRTW